MNTDSRKNDITVNSKNQYIVDEFEKLLKQIEVDIEKSTSKKEEMTNMFRLKSIRVVIKTLKKFPDEIVSINQFKNIKGIGQGTCNRIDEIIKTGKLSEIRVQEKEDKDTLQYIKALMEVIGIGRKKAHELVTVNKIHTVKELQEKFNKGTITLNDNIAKGLKYFDIYKQKIPREEVFKIEQYLHKMTSKVDNELVGIICGSYRRVSPTSNDIDCMITHPSIKTKADLEKKKNYLNLFVKKLIDDGFIIDSLTGEDVTSKYMGFCQLKNTKKNKYPVRRIDIRYMPYESYYTALLYFTGPGEFNMRMRQLAISQNYMLNEYGLFVVEGKEKIKRIKINSEKEVFDILGMEYLDPEKRK